MTRASTRRKASLRWSLGLMTLLLTGCPDAASGEDEPVAGAAGEVGGAGGAGGVAGERPGDGGEVAPDATADSGPRDQAVPRDLSPAPDLAPPDGGADAFGLRAPAEVVIDELQAAQIAVAVTGGSATRVFVSGLPPGARWEEDARRVVFTPDEIQGGLSWVLLFTALEGDNRAEARTTLRVRDTVVLPPPMVDNVESVGAWERVRLRQPADPYLDPDGRTYEAIVTRPAAPDGPRPVRIRLHGFAGGPVGDGWDGEYRIAPHDPLNTYWWGQGRDGQFTEYTQRRILHLLDWVLRTHPQADPERVYIEGPSMGGAGAATFGLRHARHVAWVEATIGQAIPRNHRPTRVAQLTGVWGEPGPGWDLGDLTRVLRDDVLARQQFIFLKHGKDDPIIHFGAMVHPSPLTGLSFYQALQRYRVGHLAVWDEGGHGVQDPVLAHGWWHRGWNPIFDTTARLRRSEVFPAFGASSADGDPGDGNGNGQRPFNAESGYAGDVGSPGDTGWTGDIAGVINRGLRWDSRAIVDTIERLEIPLKVLVDDEGNGAPQPGYPTPGDAIDSPLPVRVDVTLRRVQRFQTRPGEVIRWRFGSGGAMTEGRVDADEGGRITIPRLPLTGDWQTLTLSRSEPFAR